MAKQPTKKQKPIPLAPKPKAKPPADPARAARRRRVAIHALAAIAVLAAVGGGLRALYRHVDRKIALTPGPPRVVLVNRPAWMSDLLAEQIAKVAKPIGAHSSFDRQLLETTYRDLSTNPWIREVRQVRRAFGHRPGDTLEIDCDYRAPVALVHWKDCYWLVDGNGVKLPEAFTARQVPQIAVGRDGQMNIRVIEGVTEPPPGDGRKWPGDDLAAGLELVKTLFGVPYTEEVIRVDVANYAGRADPKEPQLVLGTRYGTHIRWGRPVTVTAKDFFVEVSPAQKLAYLKAVYTEKHRVDGGYPWIDIRFDAITYPSPGTAQVRIDATR